MPIICYIKDLVDPKNNCETRLMPYFDGDQTGIRTDWKDKTGMHWNCVV